MKINRIVGREVFTASGEPTLCCDIVLENEKQVSAILPIDETMEQEGYFVCYDGGSRYNGKGMQKAVMHIDTLIAPALLGKEPDLFVIDAVLSELDGTTERTTLGANVTLAVSMAVCKAQAVAQDIELFEVIAQLQDSHSVSLPFPLMTIVNEGLASSAEFPCSSIFVVPVGAQNFKTALEYGLTIFDDYKKQLIALQKKFTITADGAISFVYDSFFEPLDILKKTLQEAELENFFVIGFDIKAHSFYDQKKELYLWRNKEFSSDALINFYQMLVEKYPVYSFENALSWHDIQGNKKLFESLGSSVQIASNDGFIHNATLLQGLHAERLVNASIINSMEYSTISELLEAILFAQSSGLNTIIKGSQSETEDTFLADLTVGTSSGQIQIGGGAHSQYMAKYNRLLLIEDFLATQLLQR